MESARKQLKTIFGYSTFRPQQEEIIRTTLEKEDTIVLMPTGGGKSICYQIPALVFDGTTLVISPLISLMKDQVEGLRSNGVEAAFFNSSQPESERAEVIQQAKSGTYKLLYMAPETVFPALDSWLSMVPVSMIAIDEAHCVSMWGHDFRPEYTQLHLLRNYWKDIPFSALTATADKATRKEIENKLGLKNPHVFLSSFDRPNISLEVRGNIPKKKKQEEILDFIEEHEGQSGIIYCLSRKETEDINNFLLQNGIPSNHYHAGLSNTERSRIQEDFIHDRTPVITATIAFGMGIDKSNVRWVIHNNLPKNLEGYYQEIGRAGRDGLASKAVLYYTMRDVKLLADFARDSSQKEVLTEKLNRMLHYAESQTCRRKTLLSYFSENLEENCGNCDVCLNPPSFIDGKVIAQKALSGIKRTHEQIGLHLLIQLLRGAKTADIYTNGYQNLKTYGAGRDLSNEEWLFYLIQLLNQGAIEIAYDENFHLKTTPFGDKILFEGQDFLLAKFSGSSKKRTETKTPSSSKSASPEEELFQKLRQLRRIISKEEEVPAYIIFSDAALKEMASQRPVTKNDFLDIPGVGHQKMMNYGDEFITVIREFEKTIKPEVSTYEKTYELYKEGLLPEEIATIRKLNKETVYSHLAKLYLEGTQVDLLRYVETSVIDRVREFYERTKDSVSLKPYFEHLNGEIPYYQIRLALSLLEKESAEL